MSLQILSWERHKENRRSSHREKRSTLCTIVRANFYLSLKKNEIQTSKIHTIHVGDSCVTWSFVEALAVEPEPVTSP